MTLPVIRALETSPDAEELRAIVTDMDMTDEMVERALAIVKATDAVDFAKTRPTNTWRTPRKYCRRNCRRKSAKPMSWWLTLLATATFKGWQDAC